MPRPASISEEHAFIPGKRPNKHRKIRKNDSNYIGSHDKIREIKCRSVDTTIIHKRRPRIVSHPHNRKNKQKSKINNRLIRTRSRYGREWRSCILQLMLHGDRIRRRLLPIENNQQKTHQTISTNTPKLPHRLLVTKTPTEHPPQLTPTPKSNTPIPKKLIIFNIKYKITP